jgi:hypothetical protein
MIKIIMNIEQQWGKFAWSFLDSANNDDNDDDDVYLHGIHSQQKLENYAPCVKYRPAKRHKYKQVTNNAIKANKWIAAK